MPFLYTDWIYFEGLIWKMDCRVRHRSDTLSGGGVVPPPPG